MLPSRTGTSVPPATVTFISRRTGEVVACFEHQTRRQVASLLAQPPVAAHVAYEVAVSW